MSLRMMEIIVPGNGLPALTRLLEEAPPEKEVFIDDRPEEA